MKKKEVKHKVVEIPYIEVLEFVWEEGTPFFLPCSIRDVVH